LTVVGRAVWITAALMTGERTFSTDGFVGRGRVGRHAPQNDISAITITDTTRRRVATTTTG